MRVVRTAVLQQAVVSRVNARFGKYSFFPSYLARSKPALQGILDEQLTAQLQVCS